MAKATYRNSIRSQKMIKQAFLELINTTNDVSKISVTDIVNKANLNRGTFYSHYVNIEALVKAIFADITNDLNKVLESFSPESFKENPSLFFSSFGNHIMDNELFYKQLANGNSAKQQLDYLCKIINKHISSKYLAYYKDVNPDMLYALSDYFSNGMFGLYVDWLKGTINLSLDDINLLLTSIFNKSIPTSVTSEE